jgi:hypothetical protein
MLKEQARTLRAQANLMNAAWSETMKDENTHAEDRLSEALYAEQGFLEALAELIESHLRVYDPTRTRREDEAVRP